MTARIHLQSLDKEIPKSQSAFQISKKLISIDHQQHNELFGTLTIMYDDFLRSRNALYPRNDVLTYLTNVLIRTENRQIMNIIIALFVEFCQKSKQYDCVHVKKELLQLNITQILGVILHTSPLQKQILQVELTMLLLDNLSDSLLPSQSHFIQTELVPKCLSLCDHSERRLFHYRTSLKNKMKDLLIRKTLILYKQNYEDGDRKEKVMQYLFGCKNMVLSHCCGDVWDASGTPDVNIGKLMIDSKLVWHSHTYHSTNQNEKDNVDSYLNIIPTTVLRGPHFFAHTYETQQESVCSSLIETQLGEIECLLADQQYERLSSPPDSGDLVTVYGQIESEFSSRDGSSIYYRAQVCTRIEERYLVISLDYGFVIEVPLTSIYERCESALHIRPSAILCTISGIQPSPISEQVLESVLNILTTLSRGNFSIIEAIAHHGGFKILIEVAKISACEKFAVGAMNVLIHMAQHLKLRSDNLVKEELIPCLIELITLYSTLTWITALNTAIKLLANFVLNNTETHDQLNPVLCDIIKLVGIHSEHTEVKKSVLQLLSNILSEHKLTEDEIMQLTQERKTKSPRTVRETRRLPTFSDEFACSDDKTLSTVKDNAQPHDMTCVTHELYQSDSVNSSNVVNNIQRVEPIQPEPQLQSILLNQKEFTRLSSDKIYILDEDTGLVESEVLEICQDHVNKMDTEYLKKLIVGFLNSGISGSIMFGLSKTGKVVGLNINRDERDQLRLALDRLVTDFEPKIIANDMPQLLFCPVNVRKVINDSHEQAAIPDRYVIEICLETNPNIETAYTLKLSSAIYLRNGIQTINVTVQKYREMITQSLERKLYVQ